MSMYVAFTGTWSHSTLVYNSEKSLYQKNYSEPFCFISYCFLIFLSQFVIKSVTSRDYLIIGILYKRNFLVSLSSLLT